MWFDIIKYVKQTLIISQQDVHKPILYGKLGYPQYQQFWIGHLGSSNKIKLQKQESENNPKEISIEAHLTEGAVVSY